jgi:hypothetical protein
MLKVPQRLIEFYSHIDWLKTLLTGLNPVLLPEFAQRLKYDQKYSSQKAIETLNYKITPFHQGLWKTANYVQKHYL